MDRKCGGYAGREEGENERAGGRGGEGVETRIGGMTVST